jgi:hypothetical protein
MPRVKKVRSRNRRGNEPTKGRGGLLYFGLKKGNSYSNISLRSFNKAKKKGFFS